VKRGKAKKAAQLWQLRVELPAHEAEAMAALEAVLEAHALALSRFERAKGRRWRIEALFDRKPPRREAAAWLDLAGLGDRAFQIEPVPPRNWVAESRARLPALKVGRFFIHGSHHEEPVPRGKIGLEIDAGLAFGTGRHETTRLCLELIGRLASHPPRRPLDLGCGTGILALAMARLWDVPVLAADNDPQAVAVARENVRRNGLAARVRVVKSDGYRAAALRRAAPFDLVVANILANPLIEMAPGLVRHLAPGGRAILSGLMTEQEREVLAPYLAHGLRCEARLRRDDWSALLLRKPGRRSSQR
jgi:ribosomal protein L11 methyltransferase